jgi:hypothetical protein
MPDFLAAVTPGICSTLENVDRDLAESVQDRIDFETLLAELSASFLNGPVNDIDAAIKLALWRLVEFLRMDRGTLAELLLGEDQQALIHSWHMPEAPANPRMIQNEWAPPGVADYRRACEGDYR